MMSTSGGMNGTAAVETVNAAIAAVASMDNRDPQAPVQKRRWSIGRCWSPYRFCFGSPKTTAATKRIRIAALLPEPSSSRSNNNNILLPFAAPPSSPASFRSPATSPTVITFSSNFLNDHLYYPHETQSLASPPVLSAVGTEPSTGPHTPSPELVEQTMAPSSPDVPFARFLKIRSFGFGEGEGGEKCVGVNVSEKYMDGLDGEEEARVEDGGGAKGTNGHRSFSPIACESGMS